MPRSTPEQSQARDAGFTLIEMLIVLAVIAILVAIAVPTYTTRRISANEAAIISTLKTITQAQLQFRAMGQLDLNNDSNSEFATLPELAAAAPLRGTNGVVNKNLISPQFGRVNNEGLVARHGYLFCLYLPGTDGIGIAATTANTKDIDAVLAHDFWTLIAWPMNKGVTGQSTYFTSQQGEILKTRYPVYTGESNKPKAGAGLVGVAATHIDTQEIAVDTVGADGSLWVVVN